MSQHPATDAGGLSAAPTRVLRAIEVGFPIVEINRLAEPERNSFKPIYQMHKWFARRASCVFRAILLGALKPAANQAGEPTDLMAEFHKDHGDDADTREKIVLDPFMGGGTTVIEALRLGCRVIGVDLNPVAWFIVKTEADPVDAQALREAFERLVARPVGWNGGKPVRETLLDLYKMQPAPGIDADAIYTFWVKHAVCTDANCKREVPLFKDWFIARRTVNVRHHQVEHCPACKKSFSWEIENASLIAETSMMTKSSLERSSAWAYAPAPKSKKDHPGVDVVCPHCERTVRLNRPSKRPQRKTVDLAVLLCPTCEAVWQIRGPLPEGSVQCPACEHSYDPRVGNVPSKGSFQCQWCGNRDKIIHSVRQLPRDQRLTIRPYAFQAYCPNTEAPAQTPQAELFAPDSPQAHAPVNGQETPNSRSRARLLSLPENGKFFARIAPADQLRFHKIDAWWDQHKEELPYPKSEIPRGAETARLLEHHYNHWCDMFAPRQLLGLATLLDGIMAEPDERTREMLLCAFSATLNNSNTFSRYHGFSYREGKVEGVFARHDFQPKTTICESNVFGIRHGYGAFLQNFEKVLEGKADTPQRGEACLLAQSSANLSADASVVITDPPYVGNVNYAELSDFFYVWLRLALKGRYPQFAPEHTPKVEEIVENDTRKKTRDDFYHGLSSVFQRMHQALPADGLLVFTFHHTDEEGKVWEGLLQSLCDTGFEIAAVYPVHGEAESSLHLMDKENISYDLIHVCRKRKVDPEPRVWAGIRRDVRSRARAELTAIEAGRYGGQPLAAPDVRLICIGKCLELYSAHYDKVLDHMGKTFPLHEALKDIATIVDQLVTRDRPLPPELEDIDSLSYAWLRLLASRRAEISVDRLSKGLRARGVNAEDLKRAGLITRGRATGGRAYEVKQPRARLPEALERIKKAGFDALQGEIFEASTSGWSRLHLVDVLHALIGLAESGESVLTMVDRFESRRSAIISALRFVRLERPDWHAPIDRVLAVLEGAPLFRTPGLEVPV